MAASSKLSCVAEGGAGSKLVSVYSRGACATFVAQLGAYSRGVEEGGVCSEGQEPLCPLPPLTSKKHMKRRR